MWSYWWKKTKSYWLHPCLALTIDYLSSPRRSPQKEKQTHTWKTRKGCIKAQTVTHSWRSGMVSYLWKAVTLRIHSALCQCKSIGRQTDGVYWQPGTECDDLYLFYYCSPFFQRPPCAECLTCSSLPNLYGVFCRRRSTHLHSIVMWPVWGETLRAMCFSASLFFFFSVLTMTSSRGALPSADGSHYWLWWHEIWSTSKIYH